MPPQQSPGQAAPAPALSGAVLLVEDDVDVRNAACDLLESEGSTVIAAGDGREALDLLRAGLRPSVIVLDLTMPRMDGCHSIRPAFSRRSLTVVQHLGRRTH